jgi:hypothetical protein
MHPTRIVVPGLLAGSLLLGGTSGVFAAKAHKAAHRAALVGQVSNLSTSGFTLSWTPSKGAHAGVTKTVSVAVSATTKERGLKGATALADGNYAYVAGTRAKGTVTAKRVVFSTTALTKRQILALRGLRVRGTVVSSTPTELVVTVGKKGKTLTITLDSATKYRVSGQVSTTAPTFTAGERVVVRVVREKGATKGTKTYIAKAVSVPTKQS